MPAGFQDNIDPVVIAGLQTQLAVFHCNVLDNPVGESIFDRTTVATGTAATTQQLRLGGFTAQATQNISRVRVTTGSTAAGATPTLCQIGVWARDSSNNYNQVALTANDPTLFAGASTTYTPSFASAFLKTAGVDYMVGILIVSAAAFPTFMAPNGTVTGSTAYMTDFYGAFPQLCAVLTGQAAAPATFAAGSLSAGGTYAHALLLQ